MGFIKRYRGGGQRSRGGELRLTLNPALQRVRSSAFLQRAISRNRWCRWQSSRFIAGETLEDGLCIAREMNGRGIVVTLNHTGTHSSQRVEAATAAQENLNALEAIEREGILGDISVKLTNIGLDIDTALCRELLHAILHRAMGAHQSVTIDMEEHVYLDRTMALFEEAAQIFGVETVKITVQAYLRRSDILVKRLLNSGSRIRLVRGGYVESGKYVLRGKSKVQDAFRKAIVQLLDSGVPGAVATHDRSMIEEIRRRKVGAQCEFQLLYGVHPELALELAQGDCPVRCYIPYGPRWQSYVIGCVRKSGVRGCFPRVRWLNLTCS